MKTAAYTKAFKNKIENRFHKPKVINNLIVNNVSFCYVEPSGFDDDDGHIANKYVNQSQTIKLYNYQSGTWVAKTDLLSSSGHKTPEEAIDRLKILLNAWMEETKIIEKIIKELK